MCAFRLVRAVHLFAIIIISILIGVVSLLCGIAATLKGDSIILAICFFMLAAIFFGLTYWLNHYKKQGGYRA